MLFALLMERSKFVSKIKIIHFSVQHKLCCITEIWLLDEKTTLAIKFSCISIHAINLFTLTSSL